MLQKEISLHDKIAAADKGRKSKKHNEHVCHIQDLGCHAQGEGQVKVQNRFLQLLLKSLSEFISSNMIDRLNERSQHTYLWRNKKIYYF